MRTLAARLRVTVGDSKQYALALSWLLTPVTVTGYTFALWRLGADLKWTGDFFIPDGVLSRWQVWLALAIATQAAAHFLNNRSGSPATPPVHD
jgi:hypothetical protein